MRSDIIGGGVLPMVALEKNGHGQCACPLHTSRICQQIGQLLDDASGFETPELQAIAF